MAIDYGADICECESSDYHFQSCELEVNLSGYALPYLMLLKSYFKNSVKQYKNCHMSSLDLANRSTGHSVQL